MSAIMRIAGTRNIDGELLNLVIVHVNLLCSICDVWMTQFNF
jgi:hypothetical protein